MPKNLQPHQLRVAAVGKQIGDACNAVGKNVDTENIMKACLLHDMGNIIKFDLPFWPEFLEPEGLEYWQKVKSEFVNKYENNEHIATDAIVKEISAGKKVEKLLSLTGFSKVLKVLEDGNLEKMICNYADMRVGPFGIMSVEKRCEDGKARHARKTSVTKNENTDFDKVINGLKEIEKIIFRDLKINPTDINDESIEKLIPELKKVEI